MIYGDDKVEYTPAEGYSTNDLGRQIISGGSGDVTITQDTRFYWRYDPTGGVTSGFTGCGWFIGEEGTPLENYPGITNENDLISYITSNQNLDAVFQAWQKVVDGYVGPEEDNPVNVFIRLLVTAGGASVIGSCYSAA